MVSCTEKERLTQAYMDSVKHSSVAASDLNVLRGRATREEYRRVYLLAQKALVSANDAFLELSKHAEKHGC